MQINSTFSIKAYQQLTLLTNIFEKIQCAKYKTHLKKKFWFQNSLYISVFLESVCDQKNPEKIRQN